MSIIYEWCINEMITDDSGDIDDNHHSDTLKGYGNAYSATNIDDIAYQLELIRDDRNEENGLLDRVFAQVSVDNHFQLHLPDRFEDGPKIPLRFFAELDRWQNANKKRSK